MTFPIAWIGSTENGGASSYAWSGARSPNEVVCCLWTLRDFWAEFKSCRAVHVVGLSPIIASPFPVLSIFGLTDSSGNPDFPDYSYQSFPSILFLMLSLANAD
jgi:hypothetical protein